MKFILSPSKRQESYTGLQPVGRPMFETHAEKVSKVMKAMNDEALKKNLKLSDKLTEAVADMWKQWGGGERSVAIAMYQGDVYDGLDLHTLSDNEKVKAMDQAIIMSALYGVLKGGDAVEPHRIDLNDPIKIANKTLKKFWSEKVEAFFDPSETFIDLTSTEYQAMLPKDLETIRIDFKEEKGGKLKTVSFFAKKARGQFARWILQTDPKTIQDLRQFNMDGYRYHEGASADGLIMFTRTA